MKPKDGMDDNTIEEPTGTQETVTTSNDSETQPKTEGNETTQGKVYTEAQYKGLQAVIAKRDGTIANQANRISELEAKLAEAEANHGSAVSEKTTVGAQLKESQTKAAELEKEVANLQKKVKYQDIVMKEFPDLSQAASFIPDTDNEDDFREKAKELRGALNQIVKSNVQDVLGGASLPLEAGDGGTSASIDELDKAYRDVVALAGIPGKEQEYEKAYDRYVSIQEQRQKTT